jgi:periplasmic protein CpxP/Spy
MLKNRLIVLCAAALAVVSTAALAQDTKPGKLGQDTKPGQDARGQRRGNGMNPKALTKALELTPEQEEKLKPIAKKAAEARKKLNEDTSLQPKEKREKVMEITKGMMKSVEEILTPEQKKKFEELKKKMEEAAKNRKKKNS